MKSKLLLTIILPGLWITFSEFLRNEILFKYLWIEQYKNLNLVFETLPLNGVLWMVWSFGLAFIISEIREKFNTPQTLVLVWIISFPMMWITLYNLQVLPLALLFFAVPLSIIEIYIALLIPEKLLKAKY